MQPSSRRQFLLGSASALGAVGPWPGSASAAELAAPPAIDVHAHMPLVKFANPLAARFSRDPQEDTTEARLLAQLAAAVRADSFEALAGVRVEEMDRWGVVRSVAMPIDFGFSGGEDRIEEELRALAAACRAHAGRLLPFLGCDPRRPNAIALLERAAREFEVKGVKLHPLAGFNVDDRELCYRFYEKCGELGLPVLGHCRPLGRGPRDDFYRPERYGRVARDFPDLKICLGHAGGPPWREQALEVIAAHDNAFGDISSHQTLFLENTAEHFAYLKKAMDSPARTRLMFGTDWPNQREVGAAWLAAIRSGGVGSGGEPVLDSQEIELLLAANARRFLGL